MIDVEQKAVELKLDRSSWALVRFGDVAIQQKQSVDRENTHLKRYVKGEHMASEDLHLRGWGNLEDEYLGPAFIRYFEEGDILYGSRRTYLRKVTVAPFEGITSNTTFVVKPNEDLIDRRLLPFLMLSEGFSQHSIRKSKGSVNPYINWKDIASYEFLLPPKEQQAELAELLWAMDEVVERNVDLFEKLNQSYEAESNSAFSPSRSNCDFVSLDKIATINNRSLTAETDPTYEFKYLDISSIVAPKKIGPLSTMTYASAPSRARRIVSDNSIVLSLVRPYQKGFVFVETAENIIASTGTGVVDIDVNLEPRFIYHQFFSSRFLQYCENRMTGTNYPAITPRDLAGFKIIIPSSEEEIKKVLKKLDTLDRAAESVQLKLEKSKFLQKSLINQVF